MEQPIWLAAHQHTPRIRDISARYSTTPPKPISSTGGRWRTSTNAYNQRRRRYQPHTGIWRYAKPCTISNDCHAIGGYSGTSPKYGRQCGARGRTSQRTTGWNSDVLGSRSIASAERVGWHRNRGANRSTCGHVKR